MGKKAWQWAFKADALSKQGGKCLYCWTPITVRQATIEHKIPRSRKGGNERHNIGASCDPCNQTKGTMTHEEFCRLIDGRFPAGARIELIMVWATRRIWMRAHQACRRIEGMTA